jgi:C1A family cysteine protease
MKGLILALSALAITGLTLMALSNKSDNDLREQFMTFKAKYNKSYGSKNELEYRFTVFSSNVELIKGSNADSSKRFTLAQNQFTDMTFDEFKNQYLMNPKENEAHSTLMSAPLKSGNVDWRTVTGAVGAVKNQGQCGSCWAFSTVASMETSYFLRFNKFVSFSEQQLVDCASSYGNHGCNGGLMPFAYEYIIDNKLTTESAYPYRGVQGTCRASSMTEKYGIDSFAQINPVDVNGLMAGLDQTVVSVAIEVQNDFMFYNSGVYHSTSSCGQQLNHGVAAVGYNSQSSDPYFIVRNSWGPGWGLGGYVRMALGSGSGTCGIANPTDTYPLFA